MKTKEKIIHTAIEMFNERGFGRVSLGEISQQLNMSKGNLTYHFKNRGDLLKAIYEKMFTEMEGFVQSQDIPPLALLVKVPLVTQQFTHRYRFFFANLVTLSQEFPWIALQHQQIVANRLKFATALLHNLVQRGEFLPEPQPLVFEKLAHLVWMTTTFWHVQYPILPPDHPAHQTKALASTISTIIQPFLSPKGLEEWNHLNAIQNENDQN